MIKTATAQRAARSPTLWSAAWLAALAVAALAAGCSANDAAEISTQHVSITLETGASAKIGDKVIVSAHVYDVSYMIKSYAWSVSDPYSNAVTVTAEDSSKSRVSFKVEREGTYLIVCRVSLEGTSEILQGEGTVQVEDPAVKKLVHTARIIPPASAGLPPWDKEITVGSADQSYLAWAAPTMREVTASITDGSAALPATVRILRSSADPMPRDVYLPQGTGKVKVTGTFHALVIPDGNQVPAQVELHCSASTLKSTWTVKVDKGFKVQGKVAADSGPLSAARVMVHTTSSGVEVPSTLGTSDSSGAFSLSARAGPIQLTVAPPTGSGLPVAVVTSSTLSLASDQSGWSFTFHKGSVVKVSGTVYQSDGTTPASGATVHLSLDATTGSQDVGVLQTGAGSFTAAGKVSLTLVADSTGVLKDPASGASEVSLPQGTYTVETWPGASAPASEGYMAQTVTLSGTSLPTQVLSLKLGQRAKVTGKVVDASGTTVLARVRASSTSGIFETTTDSKGTFSLQLNDSDTYSLLVRSVGRLTKAGSYLQPALKIYGSQDLGQVKLPAALVLSGKVTTSGGLSLAGASIRIWCSDPDCESNEVLDETFTLSGGSFELRVAIRATGATTTGGL